MSFCKGDQFISIGGYQDPEMFMEQRFWREVLFSIGKVLFSLPCSAPIGVRIDGMGTMRVKC